MTPHPSKRAKRAKPALSPSQILKPTSPILNKDIHGFLSTCLSPVKWHEYSEDEKRRFIDLFPPAYRKYSLDTDGRLQCPVDVDFVKNDNYIKTAVASFKRDVESGFWDEKWQEQARKAMKERREGKFDGYLRDHTEELFGETNQSGNGQAPGEVENGHRDEHSVASESDGGNERGKRKAEEERGNDDLPLGTESRELDGNPLESHSGFPDQADLNEASTTDVVETPSDNREGSKLDPEANEGMPQPVSIEL